MTELPEKLGLEDFFDFIEKVAYRQILSLEETNNCEKIIHRYNAYADQQAVIMDIAKVIQQQNVGRNR